MGCGGAKAGARVARRSDAPNLIIPCAKYPIAVAPTPLKNGSKRAAPLPWPEAKSDWMASLGPCTAASVCSRVLTTSIGTTSECVHEHDTAPAAATKAKYVELGGSWLAVDRLCGEGDRGGVCSRRRAVGRTAGATKLPVASRMSATSPRVAPNPMSRRTNDRIVKERIYKNLLVLSLVHAV